jgi:hypothetical protein
MNTNVFEKHHGKSVGKLSQFKGVFEIHEQYRNMKEF